MIRINTNAACLLLLGWISMLSASHADKPVMAKPIAATYAVVTNAGNRTSFADEEAARQEVRKLFLRTQNNWPTNVEAKPFNTTDSDPSFPLFLAHVVKMSKAEYARHWISMKNKNGVAPPKEISSSNLMIKYIEKFDGGLGVVSIQEAKQSGIRILFEF